MNGTLVSTQFLTQKIDVTTSDDYVVPTASIEFIAPDGTILSTGCATAVGKRLEAEEPDPQLIGNRRNMGELLDRMYAGL
jgi:hypothetical protein